MNLVSRFLLLLCVFLLATVIFQEWSRRQVLKAISQIQVQKINAIVMDDSCYQQIANSTSATKTVQIKIHK